MSTEKKLIDHIPASLYKTIFAELKDHFGESPEKPDDSKKNDPEKQTDKQIMDDIDNWAKTDKEGK